MLHREIAARDDSEAIGDLADLIADRSGNRPTLHEAREAMHNLVGFFTVLAEWAAKDER